MNIVVANGPGVLDNGQEVILFPSRWDSGIPHGHKKPFAFYPYQLCYLASLLKRELPDANVKMLDGNIEGWNGDRYIQEIAKYKPDVLICECSALTYPTMTRVMQANRSYDMGGGKGKSVQTILCGPMAAGNYETRMERARDGWCELVAGEYELKVLELLGSTVPPEARTDAGLINLDWLPWPEDEDVDRSRYREINHYIDYRSNAVFPQVYLTRGCPLACGFCTVPNYYGGHGKSHKSHRGRDVDDCCEEILYLKAMYGDRMKGAFFNDEAHNANVDWLVSLCEAFIKRGMKDKYNLRFDAMCGYWPMTEELVKLMAAAGYNQIRFGLESTSIVVGKKIGKAMHLGKLENFMGWLKKYGVHGYATVQIGAAGSTEETDRQTIADVKKWIAAGSISKWQISTSTPQPNTPFFQECLRNGWLTTTDFSQYDGYRAVVNFPDYPAERIQYVRDTCGL